MTRGFHLVARHTRREGACLFPGSGGRGDLVSAPPPKTNFSIGANVARRLTHHFKVREGEAPPPAREGAWRSPEYEALRARLHCLLPLALANIYPFLRDQLVFCPCVPFAASWH